MKFIRVAKCGQHEWFAYQSRPAIAEAALMMPVHNRLHDWAERLKIPDEEKDVRRRSTPKIIAVLLSRSASSRSTLRLYSLIQAFDIFDLPTPLKIWFSRTLVAMAFAVIALRIGGKRVEMLQRIAMARSSAGSGHSIGANARFPFLASLALGFVSKRCSPPL